MGDTSELAFSTIGRKILTFFPHARQIYHDFEENVHSAITSTMPRPCEVRGSFYKYCSIIFLKARELGIRANEENDIILTKMMALPIIDPNDVIPTFVAIKKGLTGPLAAIFGHFLIYLETLWIQAIGPAYFTAFGCLEALYDVQKTTTDKLQHPPPYDAWAFMRSVIVEAETELVEIDRIGLGVRALRRCPRAAPILPAGLVQDLWRRSRVRSITAAEMLATTSIELRQTLLQQMRINLPNLPDGFTTVNSQRPIPRVDFQEAAVPAMPLHEILRQINYRTRAVQPEVVAEAVVPDVQPRGQAILELPEGANVIDITCILCFDAPRNRICSPCGHFILCDGCSLRLLNDAANHQRIVTCPACQQVVNEIQPAFIL